MEALNPVDFIATYMEKAGLQQGISRRSWVRCPERPSF